MVDYASTENESARNRSCVPWTASKHFFKKKHKTYSIAI